MSKLLLCLWGESYRSGPQLSRTRGTNNYSERQLFASQSHIDLIEQIKTNFNISTDIFINSYKLNDTDDNILINFYKNNNVNLIKYNFYNEIFPGEAILLNDIYDNICNLLESKENDYEFILFIRIDLYLKKYFRDNIIFDDKIKFAHIDSNININEANATKFKNICQQIMIFPKNFYFVIKNKIIYNATHEIYNNLLANNISNDNISFFVNTLHVCSTDLSWNPLYVQVGRYYNLHYNKTGIHCDTINHIYDNNTNLLIDNDVYIEKWNEYIVNEEKMENDKIILITNNNNI
jgi:hypothetical protein